MYETVIVPLDGTPESEAALPLALAFARQTEAELQLVSVIDASERLLDWNQPRRNQSDAWLAARRREYLDTLIATLDVPDITTSVVIGEPTWSILTIATQARNPLLIMARRPRSRIRERFARGVCLRVARVAPFPLVLIPVDPAVTKSSEFTLTDVLVPLDGSPASESIVPALTGGVLMPEALHFHLLNVVDTVTWHGTAQSLMYAYNRNRFQADMTRIATRYLNRVQSSLVAAGARASCEVRAGRVVEKICRAADELDASLIAISTHGRSRLQRLLLGSVAEAIVCEANHPVLLVRARI